MTKKGRLTLLEKYAIKGMLFEEKTVEEISKHLDRSLSAVNNYIDKDLSLLCGNIAKVHMSKEKPGDHKRFAVPEKDDVHEQTKEKTDDSGDIEAILNSDIVRHVVHKLSDAGLTDIDSRRVVRSAVISNYGAGNPIVNENLLFTECIKRMRAGQFINKKTVSGKGGVAVMSSAASQRSDEHTKTANRSVSRSARGNIFDPSTGDMK